MDSPTFIVAYCLGSFFGGALVGTWIGFRFNLHIAKEARRREFREFLGQWLHKIQRVHEGDDRALYGIYVEGENGLAGWIAKLKGDFGLREGKFLSLCTPLRQLLPEHITEAKGDNREVIANPIGALLDWV